MRVNDVDLPTRLGHFCEEEREEVCTLLGRRAGALGVVHGEEVTEVEGSVYGEFKSTTKQHALSALKILPPSNPSKLIAIGLNYHDHAREQKLAVPEVPQSFLKAPSAVIGHGDSIVLPFLDHNVEHEAELAFIIKRVAKNVAPEDALQYVLGYTCANDVSDRTIMVVDRMPPRGKSCDTFNPLGPFVVTDIDPHSLTIECLVNGQIRQSSNTSELIFNIPTVIGFLSKTMTLLPGDVIITGTPAGVRPIRPGYGGDTYRGYWHAAQSRSSRMNQA